MFNFLVTALSLALGLNLASSLKSVAVKSRWWILSWEKRPLDDVGHSSNEYSTATDRAQVEAILSSHSLTEVIKLGCKSIFKKPSVTIGCSLWLLINVVSYPKLTHATAALTRVSPQAVQAFVAALGLNWSIESAVDASFPVAGEVSYSNMTQYYFWDTSDSNSADQITAHLVCGLECLSMRLYMLT